MNDKKPFIKLDLTMFENNGKVEFVHVVKRNRYKAAKALTGFLVGLKNEATDSKETSRIIVKFISNQKITKDEEKHLKTQVYDVFKILGIGVPFILIPGATLLIPFLLKAAEKKGIDLIPSNFRGNNEIINQKIMSLVTIKRSHIETELLVLKSKLESEGIKCYLKNEFTTQIMTHMATFDVELQVSQEDLTRVNQILDEIKNN
ncbi:putative signal transducing protein [Lutibacter citreus]|uniref:putative signal transducing protein n=1 Tax=Lutibacter citreus TaxID=2138210 RepID=UPI000DBE7893|nr:DUF2007 domain-containing protein [Lutibacter citreus]